MASRGKYYVCLLVCLNLNFVQSHFQVPRAVEKYPLDISVAKGRSRVRHQFELYSEYFSTIAVTSTKLAAMNAALLKGTQELVEVHNRWSQKTHVMRWFEGAWELESTTMIAQKSDKEIRGINEKISKIDVSPFLEKFLTVEK